MVCDAETGEQGQPMHDQPATPIGFLLQERGVTQRENGLTVGSAITMWCSSSLFPGSRL